ALIIAALAEGTALHPEEERAAIGAGEPQHVERAVPLGLRPLRALDEEPLAQPGDEDAAVGLPELLVRREERRDVPGGAERDRRDLAGDAVVHAFAPPRVLRRQMRVDEEEPVRAGERRAVRPDDPPP